jgi:hypothetical protein
MKVMVIAHAHPDFSVGGAEIAAYNLYRTLRARPAYAESVFLARSDLASQAHGSIMLRRPGEYLWRQDIGDWFRLRTQNPMAMLGAFREFLKRERPDVAFLHHYVHIGVEVLPADRDAARIFRHLQSPGPDGEEQHEEALLPGEPRGLQQLLPGADAAGLLAAQALHSKEL